MTRPLLSITMPTRNRAGLLERALRSVVSATAPVAEPIEVAVSDGSDDESTADTPVSTAGTETSETESSETEISDTEAVEATENTES